VQNLGESIGNSHQLVHRSLMSCDAVIGELLALKWRE